MNDLEKFFYEEKHKGIHKFPHYFEIYDRHFSRFRGKPVNVVEVGVGDGGSLQMWKDYFGPEAKIFGVDKTVDSKMFDGDSQIKIITGDQSNRDSLSAVFSELSQIDIFIDDGSHECADQILTFAEAYPRISENGVYMCEDMQTSYDHAHGGGYLVKGSFVEFSKALIDWLNAWDLDGLSIREFTRKTYALHFYCYALVVEKRSMDEILRSPVVAGGKYAARG